MFSAAVPGTFTLLLCALKTNSVVCSQDQLRRHAISLNEKVLSCVFFFPKYINLFYLFPQCYLMRGTQIAGGLEDTKIPKDWKNAINT